MTLGFFDPTIMPAYNLWKKKLADNQLPNKKELTSLMASIGWDKIQLKESAIWKESEEVQIDLGGIAKGYCVDLLTERLIDAGYNNCYVEWGGEIRTHGQHPEKRPWKVYISNLTDSNPDHALDVISLNNEALATSGDYLQQWTYSESEENKLTFTHIVHPKTLLPIKVHSKNICSATVKAKTCTMADAFATASMLFASKNDANQWIASLKDSDPLLEFWLMTREEINDLTPTPLE